MRAVLFGVYIRALGFSEILILAPYEGSMKSPLRPTSRLGDKTSLELPQAPQGSHICVIQDTDLRQVLLCTVRRACSGNSTRNKRGRRSTACSSKRVPHWARVRAAAFFAAFSFFSVVNAAINSIKRLFCSIERWEERISFNITV